MNIFVVLAFLVCAPLSAYIFEDSEAITTLEDYPGDGLISVYDTCETIEYDGHTWWPVMLEHYPGCKCNRND